MKHLNKLVEINNYLEQNKQKGIDALKDLIENANKKSIELVVLSFTYENIEAYLKFNGQFELGEELFDVLSQSKIDELSGYNYNGENKFEDYEYSKFQEFVCGLIDVWILNCFELAIKNKNTNNVKYYFKQNHDSLEILELNNCEKKFEKSEFELYTKNNIMNLINLLS